MEDNILLISTVDMTFSTMSVLRAVEEVEDIDDLGFSLNVPLLKRQEIDSQFSSGSQRKKQLIKYWIERDPMASWRGLIVALDYMGQKKAADAIRHLAEPVTGRTCTLYIHVHVHVGRGCV